MHAFPRLLCLALLATAAFAQAPPTFVTADPSLANEVQTPQAAQQTTPEPGTVKEEISKPATHTEANVPDLQLRSSTDSVLLPTATVLRLKLNSTLSTASVRRGQQFEATLTRPVEVDGRIVVPAGFNVNCEVERARGGRRVSGKPSLAIKARSVRLPSGEQLSFSASVVDTDNPHRFDVDDEGRVRGFPPDSKLRLEMGVFTGVGAATGAIVAGPEGIVIGSAAGALTAAGHSMVKYRDLALPAGTELIFELDGPATTSRPQMGGMQ